MAVEQDTEQHGAVLLHRTRRSGLLMAAGMDHDVNAAGGYDEETDVRADWARTTVVTMLRPGERLRIIKFLAYGWSSTRSPPALRDQAAAALPAPAMPAGTASRPTSAPTLMSSGMPPTSRSTGIRCCSRRSASASSMCCRPAPAPNGGPSGQGSDRPGYDGHAFWDTEGFVLPLLTYTAPHAAADALRWRPSSRRRGSGPTRWAWPARRSPGGPSTARNARRTGRPEPRPCTSTRSSPTPSTATARSPATTSLERECGLEILVETARLWVSHGHHDSDGAWHVDGVTGPDEYSAVADDNVFTNLMAARNLRAAVDACARQPDAADRLGVRPDEPAPGGSRRRRTHALRRAPRRAPAVAGFTRYAAWDFAAGARKPLMLHAPYFQLYRRQVVKQADLVLAMHWCPEAFTAEQKARNVDYYERITVRDSSLSACTQAVMCAEVGHLELAHDYAREAALVDLRDLHANTRDGLHMASLAGAWSTLVEGFGGLREHGEHLALAPAARRHHPADLPAAPQRPAPARRGQPRTAQISLHDGTEGRLPVLLYGEPVEVSAGNPVARAVVPIKPALPTPQQPPGYASRPHGSPR